MPAAVKADPEAGPNDEKSIEKVLLAAPKSVLFLPLYGEAYSEPLCFVLRVEGITCLLDCGWSESCDLSLIKSLAAIAPHVDVVLISHADIKHLGALPYAVAKLGLRAPIYATLPVQKMGQMYVYDLLVSKAEVSDFDAFDLDDVDAAFERITGVRYSQQIVLSAKQSVHDVHRGNGGEPLADVRVTAHPAGHSLGGAVWHISVQQQDFVYGVSMNLRSDGHLAACKLQSLFHRPALLITDAACVGRADPPTDQATTFLEGILTHLRSSSGNVLIPVDTAGRVLELVLMLEAFWARKRLGYPLVFLSKTATTVLDFARSQLEFLSDDLQKGFTAGTADNPFNTKHLKLCNSLEDLTRLPQQHNLVVLASSASLDVGLSQQLLLHWAANPANLILFTRAPPPASLAYALHHHALRGASSPLSLDLRVGRRVPLTPAELRQKEEAEAREAAAAAKLKPKPEPEDEELRAQPSSLDGLATSRKHSASVAQQGRCGSVAHALADEPEALPRGPAFHGVLIDGFAVPAGAVAPMFPLTEGPEEGPWDAFGAVVDLADLCGRTHYDEDDDGAAPMEGTAKPDDLVAFVQQAPSKVVYDTVILEVSARMRCFDFEGLISESSFVSMVRAVAPRNLILIQRPPTLRSALLSKVDSVLSAFHTHVHLPSTLRAVTLPATACYTALLTPALHRAIEAEAHKQNSGYLLQWFDAIVEATDPVTCQPLLGVPPPEAPADVHTRAGVFLGDMMVSEVTLKLRAAGFDVKTQGTCAVVQGGELIVRQDDIQARSLIDTKRKRSQLVIEGNLSPLYYKVRDIIYKQYQLTAQ